jgi:hypothetical protein
MRQLLTRLFILASVCHCAFAFSPAPVTSQDSHARPFENTQGRGSDVPVRDLKFTHLNTNDGLSQGYIAIVQDRRGFMWFATRDGLNR